MGGLTEQAVLEAAAGPVGVAVEVHQHVGHDHVALVVEGLTEVALAEAVACLLVAAEGDGAWSGGLGHARPVLLVVGTVVVVVGPVAPVPACGGRSTAQAAARARIRRWTGCS